MDNIICFINTHHHHFFRVETVNAIEKYLIKFDVASLELRGFR